MGNVIIVLVICLPTKLFGVLKNSFKHAHAFQIKFELGSVF